MAVQAKSSVGAGDPSQTSTGENDEFTVSPISHQPRSSEVRCDENALRLIPPSPLSFFSMVPLHTETVGAGSSAGDVELPLSPITEPRSEKALFRGRGPAVTVLPPIREDCEFSQGTTHQPENTDHINITIAELDHMCRTCGPDEDDQEIIERDNRLVKLGCQCRGSLSSMHRKCILQWFGPRIVMGNNYTCELCSGPLNGRILRVVLRASIGRDSGRDILVHALANSRPGRTSVHVPARVAHPAVRVPEPNNETGPQINIVEGAGQLPQPVIVHYSPFTIRPRRRLHCDNRVCGAVFKMLSLLAFVIPSGIILLYVLLHKKGYHM